ncbi:response regulator [Marinobacterium sp. D7]|uniref:response regulator n=1 Tax=Marinobacterium ramblicola TaxID=2849041 RepID=UPI001C2DC41E|nr:response regulator [Marinobacterium ramblicola]MBV1788977.1 response regulator [Marinobacterium ramblicola]
MHIGTIGFPADQLKKLDKILALSKSKTYTLAEFDSASLPDLVLLFGENQLDSAPATELPPGYHHRLIVVSREPPAREDLHHIKLPFISSRVIRTLEGFDPYLPEQVEATEPVEPTEHSEAPGPEVASVIESASGQDAEPAVDLDAAQQPDAVEDIEAGPQQSENRFSKYDAQIEALRLQQASIENVAERPYTVLVVDDSPPMQQALAKELQQLEYPVEISFADDGESALAQVAEGAYDFIFLDIMMPGIDGFETCTRMRAIPSMKKTPIIMLSSKSSPLDEVKGIMAGSSTYLTKPIQPEEFRKVIKRVTRWVSEFKKV